MTSELKTRIHPETGVTLHRDIRPVTLTYKSESITVDLPGWYPDGEGDGIVSGDDFKVSNRALHRMKARAEGLLEPEDIKRIRKKLRLTQVEAGELIGGGPRAFQKYESGDGLLSQGINNVLILLDNDPKGLAILRRRKSRVSVMETGRVEA
jgi:HTH-type transcriptional regulator/antitoxin MqsA